MWNLAGVAENQPLPPASKFAKFKTINSPPPYSSGEKEEISLWRAFHDIQQSSLQRMDVLYALLHDSQGQPRKDVKTLFLAGAVRVTIQSAVDISRGIMFARDAESKPVESNLEAIFWYCEGDTSQAALNGQTAASFKVYSQAHRL